MLPSYGKVYRVGKKEVQDIFKEPVVIQEKVDGWQFSFGVNSLGALECRGKDRAIRLDVPLLYQKAVHTAARASCRPGHIYRAEFVGRKRQNVLEYGRVPRGFLALFDVDYHGEREVADEATAASLGIEAVPVLFTGMVESLEDLDLLLNTRSFLGGPIEGLVIKSLALRDHSGYPLRAKYVSPAFQKRRVTPRHGMEDIE